MNSTTIETERLTLRDWIEDDFQPFADMCRDSEVMKYFPRLLTDEEVHESIRRFREHFAEHGFTYFAAEVSETSEFIGFVGIKHQTFESPFTPCVDIGWRLKREAWGKGYATEAAKACVELAFNDLNMQEVFSFCPQVNLPSQAVMKRLGMTEIGTFNHAALTEESGLNPCLAFRLSNPE